MLPAEARGAPGPPLVPRALTLAAALAVAAAGCGDSDEPGPPSDPAATELTVTLDLDGPRGERPRTRRVSCEAGADAGPCSALTPADFAPVPPGAACTQIYGGPDEATFAGAVIGEPVSAKLTRANGCEIERFDEVTPLLQQLFPGYRPGSAIAP